MSLRVYSVLTSNFHIFCTFDLAEDTRPCVSAGGLKFASILYAKIRLGF